MLNEDKLKLMTGLALFEKAEGRRLSIVRKYFKTDYISRNMLGAFLGYTFCWFLGLALALVCRVEDILSIVNLTEVLSSFTGYGIWYLLGLVVCMAVTFTVCYRRYSYAARAMRVYAAKLRRLGRRYDLPVKTKERSREVKRK